MIAHSVDGTGFLRAGCLRRLIALVALSLATFPAGLDAQDRPQSGLSLRPPPGVRVVRDIVYARYGERSLKLDLYLPDAVAARTPYAVVVIRGGGWRLGDKEAFGRMAAALAQRGVPAVSIEYRASGEAVFPAAVHDTKAAVRWLRANAPAHGLKPDRVGAIGGSAGAHLAAYLGVTSGIEELEGGGGWRDRSSDVQAVVGLATPTEFVPPPGVTAESANRDPDRQVSPVDAFLGVSYWTDPETWAFASPLTHVDARSAPILLIHSEDDGSVAPGASIRLAERYAAARVPFELVMFPGAPHAFWNHEEWFNETMDRAAAFLIRHLGAD